MEPPIERYVDCRDCMGSGGWPHYNIATDETYFVQCEGCEGHGSRERGCG